MNQEEYLAHHGILGQKWGVRRYQNSDGTLTAAGKKRYNREFERARNKDHDNTWNGKGRNMTERQKVMNQYDADLRKTKGWKKQEAAEKAMNRSAKSLKEARKREDAFYKAHAELYSDDGDARKIFEQYISPYADAYLKDIGVENNDYTRSLAMQRIRTAGFYA